MVTSHFHQVCLFLLPQQQQHICISYLIITISISLYARIASFVRHFILLFFPPWCLFIPMNSCCISLSSQFRDAHLYDDFCFVSFTLFCWAWFLPRMAGIFLLLSNILLRFPPTPSCTMNMFSRQLFRLKAMMMLWSKTHTKKNYKWKIGGSIWIYSSYITEKVEKWYSSVSNFD